MTDRALRGDGYRSADGGEEFSHIHPQRPGQAADVVDRHVPLGSLHRSHIRPVNPRLVGERFLGEAPLRPEPPEIRSHERPPVDRSREGMRRAFNRGSGPAFHAGSMDF